MDGHSITLTNPAVPEIVLTYTSFRQITDDIDDGRVFGGVHYRFDQEAGALQGERVAEYVLRHTLRPVRHARNASFAVGPRGRPLRSHSSACTRSSHVKGSTDSALRLVLNLFLFTQGLAS
jgi:hypothetical protein